MDYLRVLAASLLSLAVLFILTRLMGKKQLSELSMFDYIVGISIGSISAEMATELEKDMWLPLLAMVIYGLVALAVSYFSCKSPRLRRIISGTPVVLYENGVLYRKHLLQARLDLSDLLTKCRENGYFNLSDLQLILLEPTGQLSFLPADAKRPVQPTDLSLAIAPSPLPEPVIMDGRIMDDALKAAGHDRQWLNTQVRAQGFADEQSIFLGVCVGKNGLNIYADAGQKKPGASFF